MRLPNIPFTVLDTETTGFVPRVHRVIEFASVQVEKGKTTDTYEQLFSCAEVPPTVEVLTSIKTKDLLGKPSFEEKRAEILEHIGLDTLIVGQNVLFDIGMLKGEGIDLTERPWIDTSMLASLVYPELASYSLGYLSEVLSLNHAPKHRALGDVHATLELLGKCWERLLELPKTERDIVAAIMERSSPGYRLLFAALPPATKKKKPLWLLPQQHGSIHARSNPSIGKLPTPPVGRIDLLQESLDPGMLQSLIDATVADESIVHWIAVKNLEACVTRLQMEVPKEKAAQEDVRILYPPFLLLDKSARDRFLKQDSFTADEATLATKIAWFDPHVRGDIAVHGGEDAVWNGKIACTPQCPDYIKQFQNLPTVLLLDHRQLLQFLADQTHPFHALASSDTSFEKSGREGGLRQSGALPPRERMVHGRKTVGLPSMHVVIDDASMLEDTATKAFSWQCGIDDLCAAAEGNALLTQFTDTLQLWIEKTRQFQDVRYLTPSDLKTPDVRGLGEQIDTLLEQSHSDQVRSLLENVREILTADNLQNRIVWIEIRRNGSQFLQSVPERVGIFLQEHLFSRLPTTLLVPEGNTPVLPEILPPRASPSVIDITGISSLSLPLTFPGQSLESLLLSPPPGKTIILVGSKGIIEDMFVKHKERLEAQGTTLICQTISGGQGRMQAEFTAALAPALWLLTPWTYEGVELPANTVDHFVLHSLPFDHPSHPVHSKRSEHYGKPFEDYCLPRLEHRLFRLLRTFCRHRTATSDVSVIDERIRTKSYGKRIAKYLETFQEEKLPRKTGTQPSLF